MKQKEPILSIWCDKMWLYVDYLIGIIMLVVLIVNWSDFQTPQRLICLLAFLLPAHLFEEDTYPGGFSFMNNTGFGSKEPLVYLQNRLTNMWTNLSAVLFVSFLTSIAESIPIQVVAIVIFFGVMETIGHTRAGILIYLKYKDKGKKTIYGPGSITSYFGMLPAVIYGIVWLTKNPFEVSNLLGGFGIAIGMIVILILIPFAINIKVKSKTYAFREKGYFERFE